MPRRTTGIAAVVVLVTILPACSKPLFRPHRVATQADAGSTHVAVTMIAPWEDFIDDLQPKFEMTGARALDLVVPDTLQLDEKTLDMLGVRLKLAPPRTSITETVTEKEATGSTATRASETTTKKEPGDVSGLKAGEPLAGTRKAADLPTLSRPVGMDPMLRHWAALALFQEVRLLNRYVQGAALRYDYRPYAVRLQITVMPAARNEPYDAYATISFFNPHDPAAGTPPKAPGTTGPASKALKVPYVIPLLVTDNLEAAMSSRTVDTVRQFGLALSMLVQGFAASAEVERLLEELKSVLGRDLNSLLTVSRVSDNSLRVRLGALGQAEARYAMVPRTHNVTLLLLVDKQHADPPSDPPPLTHAPTIQLYAKTEMVDAERGWVLPSRTVDAQRTLYHDALMSNVVVTKDSGKGPGRNEWVQRSQELLGEAQQNRFEAFSEKIKTFKAADKAKGVEWSVPYAQVLWIDLISLMIGSQLNSASFDLPYRPLPHIPSQDAVMLDDGKSEAVVTVAGGRGLSGPRTSAELKVTKGGTTYTLRPERVTVSDGGREIPLVFPSLAAHAIAPDQAGDVLALQVTAGGAIWTRDQEKSSTHRVLYRKGKETLDPGFSLAVPAGAVIADGTGKGSVQVHVTLKTATRVTLTLAGADVASFTGEPADAVSRSGTGVAVSKTAVVTLALQNLDLPTPITVSAKNESNVPHDAIARPVRPAAHTAK